MPGSYEARELSPISPKSDEEIAAWLTEKAHFGLCLGSSVGDKVVIHNSVVVSVVRFGTDKQGSLYVTLAFKADRSVEVDRENLWRNKHRRPRKSRGGEAPGETPQEDSQT